jgi:ribonucleoside-diphosphate reductase alpha chain
MMQNSQNHSGNIYVINRSNEKIPMDLMTISNRLKELALIEPCLHISTDYVAVQTAARLVNNIKTSEIDSISANICSNLIFEDPEYDILASRILVNDLHKNTHNDLVAYVDDLKQYKYRNMVINILHPKLIAFVHKYQSALNAVINYKNDYTYNYFGIITLIKSYLLAHKYDNNIKITKERPQQMLLRVAIGINLDSINDDGSVNSNDGTFASIVNTYELLSEKYYTHATPTLFNAGTINHTLSSCYLLSVDDSLENIYKRLTDISKISKFSGGVGIHTSMVRAHNSVIGSTIGRSEGLVPMLRVFNESTKYVSQGGGKRKGSTAVYVEPWHADIVSCLHSQKNQGIPETLCKDLFLAIWMNDLFMERLEQALTTGLNVNWSLMCPNECPGLTDVFGNDFKELYENYEKQNMYREQVSIIELWNLILSLQIETGRPYLMYKDHVNRKNNQSGLGAIKSSNLCVHGDTLILTKDGYYPIKDLAGKNVKVWNGSEWSLAPVAKTGENQQLLQITTSDGCEIKCTSYHKFPILKGNGNKISSNYHVDKIDAQDLKIGNILMKYELPIIDGSEEFNIKYPYTHGFYCGDGTNYKNKDGSRKTPLLDLYHNKQKLLEYLEYDYTNTLNVKHKKLRVVLHKDIASKFEVPINGTLDNKLKWFAGYLDADGTFVISTKTKIQSIQIGSIHKDFLYKVKLLCNTLGLNPKITLNKIAAMTLMPDNKGKGELKEYNCKAIYRLLFSASDTYKLYNELGLKSYRLVYNYNKGVFNGSRYNKIVSIKEVEGLHDTYCFNEPTKHMGIFNGLLLFNCSEICIYSDEKNVGTCNLSSICLPKFVVKDKNGKLGFDYNKLMDVMQKVTYNMNKVIDNNKYPIPEAQFSDGHSRPIGIGVQGLSSVFQMLHLPFDSLKAREINRNIFETMYYGALLASNKLAKQNGYYQMFKTSPSAKGILQFDMWGVTPSSGMWNWDELKRQIKKSGLYNSLLLAQMPTAGTSIITGHSESIEVPQSNIFTRSTLSGRFQVVNTHLVNDLKKLNLWNPTIRDQIVHNNGSVQNIEVIPKIIRDIYKTVFEYKLVSIIEMSAERECYICQSSSNNRYVVDPSINKLTKMHILSWKRGLKTSSYYVRVPALNSGKKITSSNTRQSIRSSIVSTKVEEPDEEECLSCSA